MDGGMRAGQPEAVRPAEGPRGFASIAMDYVERYNRPIMLGETNIRGSVQDGLGWLKYTYQECERLGARSDVDFRGYEWFPLWDSCAWARDLCRTAKHEADPVGIYSLDGTRLRRLPTRRSETFTGLVRGTLKVSDIPPVQFQHPVKDWLRGYQRFMGQASP